MIANVSPLTVRVMNARKIRRMMVEGELFTTYGCNKRFDCPICYNPISNHTYKIPCFRNGEWDRYGLHVAATPPSIY